MQVYYAVHLQVNYDVRRQVHGAALISMDSITVQLQEYGYAVIPDMVRIDEIGKIERFIDDGVGGGAGTCDCLKLFRRMREPFSAPYS
jgi:hypothetical protein